MSEFFKVRASQVRFFKTVPFYYQSKEGEFLLYKKKGDVLDPDRAEENRYPALFVQKKDKDQAIKELVKGLNTEFAVQLAQGGLVGIKNALSDIVREALAPGQEAAMQALPETLDILFNNMDRKQTAMEYLTKVAATSDLVVEHTVNVTALTLHYCFTLGLPEKETAKLGLCALVHDAGTASLDRSLVESGRRLTEEEFKCYQTHTKAGHDMIIFNTDFDIAVANVALEHHERMDKSGYPKGTDILCRESQLIGLIDCYEALTYRSKPFRKAKSPYDSLHLIKKEVMDGKFPKDLFKRFTACLVR